MADHQDMHRIGAAAGEMALGFAVHLGDQGAGRVEIGEAAALGLGGHGFRHAVGGEHDGGVFRHFGEFVDEDGALVFEIFHHGAVVDDFVADIDRRAVAAQRLLDDADGAVHAGAKSARACEQHPQRGLGCQILWHGVHKG